MLGMLAKAQCIDRKIVWRLCARVSSRRDVGHCGGEQIPDRAGRGTAGQVEGGRGGVNGAGGVGRNVT